MNITLLILSILGLATIATTIITLIALRHGKKTSANLEQSGIELSKLQNRLNDFVSRNDERERMQAQIRDNLLKLLKEQKQEQIEQRQAFSKHQLDNLKSIIDSLQKGMGEIRGQIQQVLTNNTQHISERLNKLTNETTLRLKEISGQVEKRLADGFEKTTATFADIVKRLALIDKAQAKITELSSNVVTLQEILSDKRSRGAFGEIQLNNLIRNMLPEQNFAFQYTLPNDKRADCILFLPDPTGNVVIDAKFPLESYQKLSDFDLSDIERQKAGQQFRTDIKKHLKDISSKYIIPGTTADLAVMFIPSEAIFAEIHAHHADLVTHSYQSRVCMVSPTTMMALLNTTSMVLKDEATRKQVNIIREHLKMLGKDFTRFQDRMNDLAKHIDQANEDVKKVHTSSQKITSRFQKIERVEFTPDECRQEGSKIARSQGDESPHQNT